MFVKEDPTVEGAGGSPTTAEGYGEEDTTDLEVSGTPEEYLDVGHLSRATIRCSMGGTGGAVSVYTRVTAKDSDKPNKSGVSIPADTTDMVGSFSLEGVSYLRLESDQDCTFHVGGQID